MNANAYTFISISAAQLGDVRGRGAVQPERLFADGSTMLSASEHLEIIVAVAGAEVRFEFSHPTELARFVDQIDGASQAAIEALSVAKIDAVAAAGGRS